MDAGHGGPNRQFGIWREKDIDACPPEGPWQLDLVPPESAAFGDCDNLYRASWLGKLHHVVLVAEDDVTVPLWDACDILQHVEDASAQARQLIGKQVSAIKANCQSVDHLCNLLLLVKNEANAGRNLMIEGLSCSVNLTLKHNNATKCNTLDFTPAV